MRRNKLYIRDIPKDVLIEFNHIQSIETAKNGRHCTQQETLTKIIREYKTLKHEKETQNNNTNA